MRKSGLQMVFFLRRRRLCLPESFEEIRIDIDILSGIERGSMLSCGLKAIQYDYMSAVIRTDIWYDGHHTIS